MIENDVAQLNGAEGICPGGGCRFFKNVVWEYKELTVFLGHFTVWKKRGRNL
jgi:hypothetical protein